MINMSEERFKEILSKILDKGKFLDKSSIFCFSSIDFNLDLNDFKDLNEFKVEHKGFDKSMNYLFGNDEFTNKYNVDAIKKIKKVLKEMGYDNEIENYDAYTIKDYPIIFYSDGVVIVVAPIVSENE